MYPVVVHLTTPAGSLRYNYIDEGLLDVINLDLPRKVRYKKRKEKRSRAPDQKYRMGRSIDDFIVKYLNDHNVKSSYKKSVTKTTVSAMFQNRKYIGEYKYRDVVVPNGVPAIVDEEIFNAAQDRLEHNRRAPASYKTGDRYILTTKLYCAECGAPMVGESAKGRHDKKISLAAGAYVFLGRRGRKAEQE